MAINIHLHGLLIIFFFFLSCISQIIFPATSSNTETEALLKLKRSFTNATSLDSWRPGTEPCAENGTWVGILCANGAVSGLRLGRLGLSGKIDMDALSSLSGLRSVAFMVNSFSGPIPEFYRVGALRGLYLSNNRFCGEIPADYFSKMEGLKKVWLSGNEFSGRVPSSLARISQLIEVHLENNRFSGPIPPLEQQSLVSVNFSNNRLEGEIPSGLSRFSLDAFEGNPGLCGGNSGRACNHHRLKITIGVVVALSALLLVIVASMFMLRRRRRKEAKISDDQTVKVNLDVPQSPSSARRKDVSSGRKPGGNRVGSRKGSRKVGDLEIINDDKGLFSMMDLMRAGAEVLGNGAIGSSYKATMSSGLTVVVKRIKEMDNVGKEKFDLEMRRLGSLRHRNLLTPLAYYSRKEEKLLVQEYQPKGSLLLLLYGNRDIAPTDLNWPIRLKIIQGIARGLHFLHTELSTLDLPHGDLKSSNVLLTQDYEPLLTDHGFHPFFSQTQASQSLIAFNSPESINRNQISPKSDVYFLGIIILEILTRKFPSQYLTNSQGGTDLVQWVRSAISDGREAELLDPDITNQANFVHEMQQLLHIGAACTEDEPDRRLDVREAVGRIEGVGTDSKYDPRIRLPDPDRGSGTIQVLPDHTVCFQSTIVEIRSRSGRRHESSDDQSSTIEMS